MFFNKVSVIIDKYMPLRKMTQREFNRKFKPWITDGILNSVNRKNKLHDKYVRTKNKEIKKDITKPGQ